MRLYIIRHGETDLNKKRLLQGTYNSQLNEDGRQQARECAAWLKAQGIAFDRVYASPLDRAMETAQIVSGITREEIIVDERIIEIGFGPYEMQPYEELDGSMMAYFLDPAHNEAPAGMERVDKVMERIDAFLEDMRKSVAGHEEECVAVVTHGVAIRTMIACLNKQTFEEGWDLIVGNCDVFLSEVTINGFTPPERIRVGVPRGMSRKNFEARQTNA